MPQIDKTKRIGFRVSLTLHLFALALALAIPWACAIREKQKPPEPMKLVQIPISIQKVSAPSSPMVEPSQAVSIPEPVKEPIQKQEAKKTAPAKKPKTVEKQTNRVTKAKASLEPPKQPEPPSEDRIREILTSGIPTSDPGILEAGDSNPILDGYYKQVFHRMYAAWNQPSQLKSLPGLRVDVRITVEPGGRITDRVKIRGSGSEIMDESVIKAVSSVNGLPPLPIGYRRPQEIIVTFVLDQ